ncbi:MAG TPA: 3-deoxy-7-phosphoheptulonate synthase [bacterium]|jgi:3-deoxy-7-phosphoheptulonate synthase|nr:3-deoxy-7-phosphoheptulonate synthase [bacterium]
MASKTPLKPKYSHIGKVSLRAKAQDTHVAGSSVLITPKKVKSLLPGSKKAYEVVLKGRKEVEAILDNKDRRLFVVVGPCSIHDPQAAHEYATRLKKLAAMVKSTIVIVMRVYFEKPRTTIGWKGLINDPDMNDSFHIEKGILQGRRLLLKFTEMGLPTATEALDPIIPQYLADLISWSAIGARTTESQTHREMASGLSMPVGFKNATDGSVQVALNGIKAANTSHHFLGIDQNGKISVFRTTGNPYAHTVLRGGAKPNYDAASIAAVEKALSDAGLPQNIVVDCSHGNSNKDYRLQPTAFNAVLDQIEKGNESVKGFMLESNINEGNQPLQKDRTKLKYGVSITDACINWVTTEELLLSAHQRLKKLWNR